MVEPLPNILYAGEILKTVRLTNNGEAIDQNEFRDVVTLNIRFDNTNNEASQNFALPSSHITQFQDDGKGMDEGPMTGYLPANLISSCQLVSGNRYLMLKPRCSVVNTIMSQ